MKVDPNKHMWMTDWMNNEGRKGVREPKERREGG